MKGPFRYQLDKQPHFKSGDSGDEDEAFDIEDDSAPVDTEGWIFWEDMKFLTQNKATRR